MTIFNVNAVIISLSTCTHNVFNKFSFGRYRFISRY